MSLSSHCQRVYFLHCLIERRSWNICNSVDLSFLLLLLMHWRNYSVPNSVSSTRNDTINLFIKKINKNHKRHCQFYILLTHPQIIPYKDQQQKQSSIFTNNTIKLQTYWSTLHSAVSRSLEFSNRNLEQLMKKMTKFIDTDDRTQPCNPVTLQRTHDKHRNNAASNTLGHGITYCLRSRIGAGQTLRTR